MAQATTGTRMVVVRLAAAAMLTEAVMPTGVVTFTEAGTPTQVVTLMVVVIPTVLVILMVSFTRMAVVIHTAAELCTVAVPFSRLQVLQPSQAVAR